MEINQLFRGEFSGGVLTISRSELELVGLSPTNTNTACVINAVFLIARSWFLGELRDHDGGPIDTGDGEPLGGDWILTDPDLSIRDYRKFGDSGFKHFLYEVSVYA